MKTSRIIQSCIGLLLLAYHLYVFGIRLNPMGVFIYVLVFHVVGIVTVLGKAVLRYYQGISITRRELKDLTDKTKRNHDWDQSHWWVLLLFIGIEGIYTLPLLYLDVSPINVLGFALVYGLLVNTTPFELDRFISRFAIRLLIHIFVLPFGIEAVVLGHLMTTLIGFLLSAFVVKKTYPIEEKMPLPEVKGKQLLKSRKRK